MVNLMVDQKHTQVGYKQPVYNAECYKGPEKTMDIL